MSPLSTAIQPGKLRHRIQIVQPTLTQDSFGGTRIDEVNLFATVRASVEALTARERYASEQMVAEVSHKITIRWLPNIKAKMNVWFDGREFQIQAVENPDERHKKLVLLCIERDDSAREGPGVPQGVVGLPIRGVGLIKVILSPDGVTHTFTLPSIPLGEILLFWNGAEQYEPDDFTRSDAVITTVFLPIPGDQLAVYY